MFGFALLGRWFGAWLELRHPCVCFLEEGVARCNEGIEGERDLRFEREAVGVCYHRKVAIASGFGGLWDISMIWPLNIKTSA